MLLSCVVLAVAASKPPQAAAPDAAYSPPASQSPSAGERAPDVVIATLDEPHSAPPVLDTETRAVLDAYPAVAENAWRIDGPLDLQVARGERRGVTTYSFADGMLIDTKLPVGYPQPTPPDVVEIKAYPGVRRAEISGSGSPDLGMNMAFWPLFQHIDRSGIAMTAPVEIDYRGEQMRRLEDGARPAGWTMSFLYEQESDGPAGEFGRVEVVDREPMLVIAAGVRGTYRFSRMQGAMDRLVDWLEASPEWEAAGEPRMLGYNGPDRRPADQWSEIQIPIRLVSEASGSSERHKGLRSPAVAGAR